LTAHAPTTPLLKMLQDDRIVLALMLIAAFFGCLSFLVVCSLRVQLIRTSKQVMVANKSALLYLPPAAWNGCETRPPSVALSPAVV
ncbi:hypothetical protein AeNC1_001472, partial [Aphanomyces euteiches]